MKEIEDPDIDKSLLMYEMKKWRAKWLVEKDVPNTTIAVLRACNKEFFPNIKTILKIFCVIPVMTSESERSFSTEAFKDFVKVFNVGKSTKWSRFS